MRCSKVEIPSGGNLLLLKRIVLVLTWRQTRKRFIHSRRQHNQDKTSSDYIHFCLKLVSLFCLNSTDFSELFYLLCKEQDCQFTEVSGDISFVLRYYLSCCWICDTLWLICITFENKFPSRNKQ